MKKTSYILIFTAIIITAIIGFDNLTKPVSLLGTGLIVWASVPYIFLFLLIKISKTKHSIVGALILSILSISFGLLALIDAMYIHLDAQGALIFIFGPLWQLVGSGVLAVPILIMNLQKNAPWLIQSTPISVADVQR